MTQTLPWFQKAPALAVRDVWAVFDAQFDAIFAAIYRATAEHPQFGAGRKPALPEEIAAESNYIRPLIAGLFVGDVAPYEAFLRAVGNRYAEGGVSFESWFDVVRVNSRELTPRLVAAYGGDPERLIAALGVVGAYVGMVMRVIGDAYLRRTEALVRAAEAESAQILEAAHDPILALDEGGRVVLANPAAERAFGISSAPLVGRSLSELLPEAAGGAGSRPNVVTYLATGGGPLAGERVELTARHESGMDFSVDIVVEKSPAPRARLIAYLRDISDRRREEESIAVWTHVLEQGEFGFIVVEPDAEIIRFVNPCYAKLFGFEDAGDLVGQTVRTLIKPAPPTDIDAVFREINRKGHLTFEANYFKRDGTIFPAFVSTTMITTPNQGRLRVSTVIDNTERRQAAEARERAAELEAENRRVLEASRMKSEFLANMSHELRTPLNAIIGFAEVLSLDDVDTNAAQRREFLGDILTSGQHLLRLINDILDLSKVEAGKLTFRSEETTFFDLADEVVNVVRATALLAGVAIVVEEAAPLTLFVDPGRLKQVLYNYLSNAIKFTPAGGKVAIRARLEGDDAFRIEVEDNGPGISPADIARLFVAFQQLDQSMTKGHGGTGLGLALTKRLVEAQGGRVGVESKLGQGSVFYAVLPRRAPEGIDMTEVPLAVPPSQPKRAGYVLVVDDDAASLRLMQATLGPLGCRVVGCLDGASAIAAAEGEAPRAVVLDLLMPIMDGFEFLVRFRAAPENRDVPIIVWTSKDLSPDELARLRASTLSIVPKGDGAATLVEVLCSRAPEVASSLRSGGRNGR
jgi:PAS domain S-box-containing protein